MSVIIKGMEVPIECGRCRLWGSCMLIKNLSPSQQVKVFVNKIKLDDCPIIEIPKNHGRISDMDEAIKCIEECEGEDATYAIGLIEWACGKRTILEAESEEKYESI